MMNHSPNPHLTPHLTYDDLLRTLVDASDLGPEQHAHLETCHRCRKQAEEMKRRYRRLGQMARSQTPAPSRPFRVPAHQAPGSRRQFKPAMALAALGVMAFVFTVWWPRPADHTDAPAPMVASNLEQDDRLMGEIDDMLDNALPEAYQQLAVVTESHNVENLDDLMDWMVPSIDEEDDIEPRA